MNKSLDETSIYGLPDYLYVGQFARTDELNARILERHESQSPLPPNFTPRPVLSRYARFPIIDARMPSNVPIEPNYNYSLTTNFTPPINRNGPVSGFINKVNTESELRNINHALQKGAGQDVYIPSSQSDLYKVTVPSKPSVQPHPGLFEQQQFSKEAHPNVCAGEHIGKDAFRNNTRTQMRGGPNC